VNDTQSGEEVDAPTPRANAVRNDDLELARQFGLNHIYVIFYIKVVRNDEQ